MAFNMFSRHYNHQVAHQLPDLQDQTLLMLCWCSFSVCAMECVSLVFDYKGGQYITKWQWHTKVNILQPAVALVLATGWGNLPGVWVWTCKMVRFGSRTIQKPNLLLLGRPNPYLYPSTCRFCCVLLDPSAPMSGSVSQDFLFMVAFRYPTVNCKLFTLVRYCLYLKYWPPLKSKRT